MSHYKSVCQFGFVHGQCRCPDPNKTERKIECDSPKHAGEVTLPEPEKDKINPEHYKSSKSGVQCIEITRSMGFCVGNAVKYLWRLGQKDDSLTELKKAQWYLWDQLALDEEHGVWQHITDYSIWSKKFLAHIQTIPEGYVKLCLAQIANYHTQDFFTHNYQKVQMLRYAVQTINEAVLEAEG